MKREAKFYNLIFPVWLILWFPPLIWLVLMPANYLVDRLVFTLSAKRQNPGLRWGFFAKHTWKLWLWGMVADLIGMLALLAPLVATWRREQDASPDDAPFSHEFISSLSYYVFANPWAFGYAVLVLAFVGLLIYLMDQRILRRTGGLTPEQAKKTALHMAIFTAPYLYFVPEGYFEDWKRWLFGLIV